MRRITIDGAYVESLQCPASQVASLYSEEFHDDNRGVWNWHFHFFIQCIQKMSQFQCLTYSISLIKGIIGWIASLDMDDDCGRVVRGEVNSILWFCFKVNEMWWWFFLTSRHEVSFDRRVRLLQCYSFFLCVFPSYVIWISLCIMLHAVTDKRKTVVVCGALGTELWRVNMNLRV